MTYLEKIITSELKPLKYKGITDKSSYRSIKPEGFRLVLGKIHRLLLINFASWKKLSKAHQFTYG